MKNMVIVPMGTFDDAGGWCLDTEFIVNMGAPYLLAHGLGKPVQDAQTTVYFPSAGTYFVQVYTYNWVSPWKKAEAPGRFQVLFNGQPLPTEFGIEGDAWCWQDGGKIQVEKLENQVILHDLTGFEGRCGLIAFTQEPDAVLPTDPEEVRALIRRCTQNEKNNRTESYDLVICGAGIAGICAALSASRRGVKTALVQDRPVVGGNNSSEVRVWLGGETNFDPYPGVGNIVNELEQAKVGHYGSANRGENYEDDRKLALLKEEKNLTVYLNHAMTAVRTDGAKIAGIEVWNLEQNCYKQLEAPLFCDCTGDSTLGFQAGADFEVTTNGHMGMTNPWYVEDTGEPQKFPSCSWAIDLSKADFPGRKGVTDTCGHQNEFSLGCWFWEAGCEVDPIGQAEYARDLNFRAMYGAWDCLKNVDADYATYALGYASFIGGKRESRRLFGDVVLTKSEVSNGVVYPDRCVPSTWNFDVHYPDRRFYAAFQEGDGFLTKDYHEPFQKPYFIPYRCLYSRNVENLFMAGRNVSVSHDALGTVRVMRTGGMMGEIVGIAAELCRKFDALPRGIYENYLDEFVTALKEIPAKELNPLVANVNAHGQE